MAKDDAVIPWSLGDAVYKNVQPNNAAGGNLGPGRWAVHTRTTIPFVKVGYARGERVLSWGETIEIVAGESAGQIMNASHHAGDIYMAAIGSGVGFTSFRPAAVTISCAISAITGPPATQRTSVVDTRLARRVYLWLNNANGAAPVPYTITLVAANRGLGAAPGSTAATTKAGNPTYTQSAIGYANGISLGLGSGQQREVAPGVNTLPELRPMALLDYAYIDFAEPDATLAGITSAMDAYWTVEY